MKKKSLLQRVSFTPCSTANRFAACYLRVSSDEWITLPDGTKDKRASVKSQAAILEAYCKKQGWEYRIYDSDCDISGYEGLTERKALAEIVDEIKQGKIHHIVVREIKRLARNRHFLSGLVEDVLIPFGVDISSTSEPLASLTTYDGKNLILAKAGKGEEDIITQTKLSMESKEVRRIEGTLRTTPPLAYGIEEKKGIRSCVVVPEEAAIVKEIFSLYLSGKGIRQIRKHLEDKGYRTRKGLNVWHNCNIRRLLTCTVYVGKLTYKGKIYPSPFPAIISQEDFDKVKGLLYNGNHRTARKNAASLLSGIIKCGYCLEQLKSNPTANENGSTITPNLITAFQSTIVAKKLNHYKTYCCQTKRKRGSAACKEGFQIKQDTVDKAVVKMLFDLFQHPLPEINKEAVEELNKKITTATDYLTKQHDKIKKATVLFSKDAIDDEQLADITKTANRNIKASENDIAELQEELQRVKGVDITKQDVDVWSKWNSLDYEQRRQALDKVVKQIILTKNELVIEMRVPYPVLHTAIIRDPKSKAYSFGFDLNKVK